MWQAFMVYPIMAIDISLSYKYGAQKKRGLRKKYQQLEFAGKAIRTQNYS